MQLGGQVSHQRVVLPGGDGAALLALLQNLSQRLQQQCWQMCELGQGAGPDTDVGSSNEGQQQVAGGCLYSILDASVAMYMCCALSPSSVDPQPPTLCLPTKPTCIIRARGLLCTRLSIRPCPRRLTRTAAGACTQGSPSTCGGGKGGRGEACGRQGRAGQAQVNKYAPWLPLAGALLGPDPLTGTPRTSPHNNRQTDSIDQSISAR